MEAGRRQVRADYDFMACSTATLSTGAQGRRLFVAQRTQHRQDVDAVAAGHEALFLVRTPTFASRCVRLTTQP